VIWWIGRATLDRDDSTGAKLRYPPCAGIICTLSLSAISFYAWTDFMSYRLIGTLRLVRISHATLDRYSMAALSAARSTSSVQLSA